MSDEHVLTGESNPYVVTAEKQGARYVGISYEEAEALDEPEGAATVTLSASLYARLVRRVMGGERLPFTAGKFGP